uniref:helix-turn-helix domain-containing protein n=1 Tax=Rhodococcus qingshengii TaxID=334542 RepID=UPI001C4E1B77
MNRGNQPAPVTVLDRLSAILDTFKGPGRLTLSQVTRRTGLPRSSMHRMLEQLVSKR